MLLNQIRPALDHPLRKNQNGFRLGITIMSQNLALRWIIEDIKDKNFPISRHNTFLAKRKALITLIRKLVKIIRAYRISERLVNAIESCMMEPKPLVPFDILAGVLQGDTLANIYLSLITLLGMYQMEEKNNIVFIWGKDRTLVSKKRL